jgi:toxin ParE1/3/4
MARFRISRSAERDLIRILATSEARWGESARRRYAHLLAAAMRKAATDPFGAVSRERSDLRPGVRSMHVSHARSSSARVRSPVHILYYRQAGEGQIEIIRVLHQRMDPTRHLQVPE